MRDMKANLLAPDCRSVRSCSLCAPTNLYPGRKVKDFKPDFGKNLDFTNEDLPLPPILSAMQIQQLYFYRQSSAVKIREAPDGTKTTYTVTASKRIRRPFVDFDTEHVPAGPESDLPPELELSRDIQKLIHKLRAELKKRPAMSRRAQLNYCGVESEYNLRYAWGYVGYLFRSGPFKDALIRFGFDPRIDPQCRIYQTMSIQLPPDSGRERLHRPAMLARKLDSEGTHIFNGEDFYTDSKVWQICDVTDPLLKGIADQAPFPTEYDPLTSGWYPNGTWALYAAIMKDKISSLTAGKERDDSFYQPFLDKWKAFITPENAKETLPDNYLDEDRIALAQLMATARGRALNFTRLFNKYKLRKRQQQGEEVTEELAALEGAFNHSDDDAAAEEQDDDSDEIGEEEDQNDDEDEDEDENEEEDDDENDNENEDDDHLDGVDEEDEDGDEDEEEVDDRE
jgi:general transcription factor 3C polypeptide 5 (transcription factor C subunit 1)